MSRFLRRLSRIGLIASVVLFVATCGLWVAAQWAHDQFHWHRVRVEGATVREGTATAGWDSEGVALAYEDVHYVHGHTPPLSFPGQVALALTGAPPPPPAPGPPSADDLARARSQGEALRRLPSDRLGIFIGGVHASYHDRSEDTSKTEMTDDAPGVTVGVHTRTRRATAPFYLVAAALGLPGLVALGVRLWRRDRDRRRPPHACAACGYDIRATPEEGGALLDRCPECGAVPTGKGAT